MTHIRQGTGELYTPVNREVHLLLERMRVAGGGTWRSIAYACLRANGLRSGVRLKVLRRLRRHPGSGGYKTISLTLMDRLVTATGVGDVRDFVWFTPDDLVALGIWEPGWQVFEYEGGEKTVDCKND